MLKLRIEKKVNGQNVTSNYDSILSYAKETLEGVSHATVVPFAFPDLKAGEGKAPVKLKVGFTFVKSQTAFNMAILANIAELTAKDCETKALAIAGALEEEPDLSPEMVEKIQSSDVLSPDQKALFIHALESMNDYEQVKNLYTTELKKAVIEKEPGIAPDAVEDRAEKLLTCPIVSTLAHIRTRHYDLCDMGKVVSYVSQLYQNQKNFDSEIVDETAFLSTRAGLFSSLKSELDTMLYSKFAIPADLELYMTPCKLRANVEITNNVISDIEKVYYRGRDLKANGDVKQSFDEKGQRVQREFLLYGLQAFLDKLQRKAGETAEIATQADGVKTTRTKSDAEKTETSEPKAETAKPTKKSRTKKADSANAEKVA